MSTAAKTIVGFGIYMALTGLILVVSPNTLFGIIGLPPTNEPWVRILGFFMMVVGYYYYRTVQTENEAFFRATVHGRTTIAFFLVYLALTGSGMVLILFAVGEWIGAGLTWWALRSGTRA